MKVRRTMPPAAAPLSTGDLFRGIKAMMGNGSEGKLKDEMAEYFGSEFIFLVSSGKAAFALILMGLSSLRSRRKILIPAYTCYSVPSAIVNAGLEIALCDVDPDTLDFDFAQLAALADEKTLCIVPTHLFGIPSDIDRVRKIAEKNGIFLVEDAAQALGVEIDGRKLGTLGDVGFFSLGRGKTITCGSGGIILTSSRDIAESIRKFHQGAATEPVGRYLRSVVEIFFMKIFMNPSLYWFPNGLPFLGIGETRFDPVFPIHRLNRFQEGILRSWREKMEEYNRLRASHGREYREALSLGNTRDIYSRTLPFLRFPVYAKTPDEKTRTCGRYGFLGISPMYPAPVNRIEQIRDRFGGKKYPGAEKIASSLMTLPTHALIGEKDVRTICKRIGGQ